MIAELLSKFVAIISLANCSFHAIFYFVLFQIGTGLKEDDLSAQYEMFSKFRVDKVSDIDSIDFLKLYYFCE